MKLSCIALALGVSIVFSSSAFATMEASWTQQEENKTAHVVSCPEYVFFASPDGSLKEHVWAHEVKFRNTNIDNGECVYR